METRKLTNYIITQTRTDAIGNVQEGILPFLKAKGYKQINIKWFKFMPLSHLWELICTPLLALRLKKNDNVLSCNSKSIYTHFLPYFTKANLFTIHYHFDDHVFGLHKLSFFNYEKLFKQWHVIFTNTNAKEFAENVHNCESSSVLPLGIDRRRFFYSGRTKRKSSLLYVGSFGHRKNINNMLRAVAEVKKLIPDITFTICNGSFGTFKQIAPLIYELGIKNEVIYLKNATLSRLIQEYRENEVFLFPTLVEGFGLPLIESVSCGCKVVTSDLPEHREVTGNLETYVDPKSPDDIAKGIIKALKRKNINQQHTEKYTWKNTSRKIYKITSKHPPI